MITQFKTWYRLWRGAVYAENRSLMVALTWIYLILAVLGGVLAAIVARKDRWLVVCAGAGFGLFMLALTLWGTFTTGAARQNHPANAKLVPGLNRQLRATAAMAWVVTTVMVLPFGYALGLGPLGPLLTVLTVSSIGFYTAGRPVDKGVALSALAVFMLVKAFPALQALLTSPLGLAVILLLCACYVIYTLPASFPAGGERHWRQVDEHRGFLAWQNLASWDRYSREGGAKHTLYAWLLKRRCRSAARGERLMLDGLGPRNNYMVVVVSAATLVAMALALTALMPLLGNSVSGLGRSCAIGVIAGQLAGAFFAWRRFSTAIRATPTEQTLLRLSAGMPASLGLTRALARRLAVTCLIEWLLWTSAACLVVALLGPSPAFLQAVTLTSAATLFLAGQPLENYAQRPVGLSAETVLLTGWMSGLLLLGLILHDRLDVWLSVLGLLLATSIGAIAYRWNTMVNGPIAFPAGRMA